MSSHVSTATFSRPGGITARSGPIHRLRLRSRAPVTTFFAREVNSYRRAGGRIGECKPPPLTRGTSYSEPQPESALAIQCDCRARSRTGSVRAGEQPSIEMLVGRNTLDRMSGYAHAGKCYRAAMANKDRN